MYIIAFTQEIVLNAFSLGEQTVNSKNRQNEIYSSMKNYAVVVPEDEPIP